MNGCWTSIEDDTPEYGQWCIAQCSDMYSSMKAPYFVFQMNEQIDLTTILYWSYIPLGGIYER